MIDFSIKDFQAKHNLELSTGLNGNISNPVVPEIISCKIKDQNASLDIILKNDTLCKCQTTIS